MKRRILSLALLTALTAAGCISTLPGTRRQSSALEFLYPEGPEVQASPPAEVALRLPVRVGLAFAPAAAGPPGWAAPDPITEAQKNALLDQVAAAFRSRESIGRIEVVPSAYLPPGGGFPTLDRLAAALGLDLMVLLSYDQAQFTESTRASWTYLTVVGPLLVEGEQNDTRTLLDAAVYDIRSRALLFRAAGESTVQGSSSPLNEERKRRRLAGRGFERATRDLIANLELALAGFEEEAKTGTVRGPGTPALAVYDAKGARVSGQGGAGALGLPELGLAALLAAAALGSRRPAA